MQHPWITSFLRFFGPYSPKYGSILVKLSPEVVFNERKRVLQKVSAKSNFQGNCTLSKFKFFFSFCPTLGPIYPMKEVEIKKNRYLYGDNLAIGLSKNWKIQAVSPLPFKWKIGLLFVLFWLFLVKKRAWSRVKGSESKCNSAHPTNTIPGHISVKKYWFQRFPVLRL